MKQSSFFIVNLMLLMLASCTSSSHLNTSNSNRPYDYNSKSMHGDITAYSHGSELSVYVTLDRSELLYTRETSTSEFVSEIIVTLGTQQFVWVDTLRSNSEKSLASRFDIPFIEDEEYLHYDLVDNKRNASTNGVVKVNDYLIWDVKEDRAVSSNSVTIGSQLIIISSGISGWEVSHIIPAKTFPAPPFTGYINSMKDVKAIHHSDIYEDWIMLDGIQKFSSHNSTDEFILYGRSSGFPLIKDVRQMLEATRYIATRSEYNSNKDADNPKIALDEFWLNCGGSYDNSKKLIEIYYGRVEEANRAFSGIQEGWRTDRGMVYIVLGIPNKIKRDAWSEIWLYGDEGSSNVISLRFRKRQHDLDNNLYILERDIIYRTTWDRLVTSWRNGRIQRD
jgi:GWxTD domain-containing protein